MYMHQERSNALKNLSGLKPTFEAFIRLKTSLNEVSFVKELSDMIRFVLRIKSMLSGCAPTWITCCQV